MNELFEIALHTDDAIMAIVADNVLKAYLVLFLVIYAETGFIFFHSFREMDCYSLQA